VNRRRRPRAAGRQAALLLVVALGVGVLFVLAARRPAAEDELKIPVGELRSQSFELKLLHDDAGRGRAARFVRAHARQLAQSIERSRDELASLKTKDEWRAARAAGLQRSAALPDAAAQLRDGGAPLAAATAARLVDAGRQLQSLEDTLRR
jgi:hypothetical protein